MPEKSVYSFPEIIERLNFSNSIIQFSARFPYCKQGKELSDEGILVLLLLDWMFLSVIWTENWKLVVRIGILIVQTIPLIFKLNFGYCAFFGLFAMENWPTGFMAFKEQKEVTLNLILSVVYLCSENVNLKFIHTHHRMKNLNASATRQKC